MRSPFRPLFKAAQRLWDHIVLAYDTRLAPAGEILLDIFVPERAEQPRWRRRPVKPEFERLEVRWVPTTVAWAGTGHMAMEGPNSTVGLTVGLSPATSPNTITVDYFTSDGTASAGLDYVATRGTLTIPANTSPVTFTINIPILDDHVTDGTETFNVTLTNPTNASISGPPTSTVSIMEYGRGPTPTYVEPVFSPTCTTCPPGLAAATAAGPDSFSPLTGDVGTTVDLPGSSQVCGCPLKLSYNTANVSPLPIITSDLHTDPSKGVPTSVQARLDWNGGTGSWVTFGTSGHAAGDDYYLGLQPGSAVGSSGVYGYTVDVVANYASGAVTFSYSGSAQVVDRDGSAFGNGWGLGPQPSITAVGGGVLFALGDGNSNFFQTGTVGTTTTYVSPTADDTSTLVKNANGTYTYTEKTGLKRLFDSNGRQVAIVNPDGLTNTYSYDGFGRLQAVFNPEGTAVTLAYDGNGRVQTATGSGSRVMTFGYNAAGDLTSVTDPAGGVRTLSYDAGHRLLTDQLGASLLTVTYDASSHKVTGVDRGGGATLTLDAAQVRGLYTTTARHQSDAVGVVTNALGGKSTYSFDLWGRRTGLATPDGATQSWGRDAWGDVLGYTDGLSRTTTYAYSGTGDLLTMTTPDGATTTATYDRTYHGVTSTVDALGDQTTSTYNGTGDLLTWTDALGRTTTYAWSGGDLQSKTDPLNHTTTYIYDANHRLIAAVNPLGNRTTQGYDAAGNVQTVTDPLGRTTTTSYDGMRRVMGVVTPDGAQTTYAYDTRGLRTGMTDPLGNRTVYAYDGRNNRISETDASGTALQRTTTMAYNALDKEVSSTDALNHTTTYGYDAVGRQTAVTDPLGRTSTTVYDAAGQAIATVDPLGNPTTTAYDPAGRAVTVADPLDQTSTTVYDTAGRVLARVDPLGNRTTTVYDAAGQAVAKIDALSRRTTTAYDAAGRSVSVTDPLNHTSTYTYDFAGHRTVATDALGRTTTTAYDAAGQAVSVTDPLSHTSTTVYDLAGRVVAAVDPLGNRVTTVYDAAGNTLATVDSLGNSTTAVYDALNRLVASVDALNNRATSAYDAANQLIASTDPLNHTTTYGYDAAGHQTAVTDAVGNTTTTVYDAAGRTIAVVDALGNRTTTAYDNAGRGVSTTDPLNHTSTTVYDAAGNTLATVDPLGNRTTFSYDALNRQVTQTNALGGVQTTAYDAAGNTSAVTNERGFTTHYYYDADNRRVAVNDPLQYLQTTVYDAAGNVLATVDQLGHATTLAYDAANRRINVTDPAGGIQTTAYDADGNTVSTTDALNHTTTYAYDALNRRVTQTDALNRTTTYAYDAAGNRTVVVDPDGNRTTFAYDAANRQATQTDPLNHVTTYAYDAAGRVSAVTDPLGQTRQYGYDAAGHELTEQWVSPAQQVVQTATFAYDADGNQLTAANPNGAYTLSYDALNRVSTAQEPFGQALTFGYDAAGNRILVQDSQGGTTTSSYDMDNHLVTRELGGAGVTPLRFDYSYRANGQVSQEVRSSSLDGTATVGYTQYSYDAKGRLTNEQHQDGGHGSLANYTYSYDAADRLSSKVENGTTFTYGYDATNQLTSDNGTAYSYDANGNRNMAGYQTGPANQTTSDGTWTYTYDADGQMVKKSKGASAETWTYGYDYAGHMTWAEQRAADGGTLLQRAEYAYDAWGNRLSVVAKDGSLNVVSTQRFAYDGWKTNLDAGGQQPGFVGQENLDVWADLDGSNALVTRRAFGNGVDELQARESAGGAVGWYLTDDQGSVRLVTNGSGSPVDTVSYDAWGNIMSESAPASGDRYKYTGRELDSVTGLLYDRARYYQSSIGKWISPDPLGFAIQATRPGDQNLYRYCSGNPLDATDPSGALKITTVEKADTECGGKSLAVVKWKFELDKPVPKDLDKKLRVWIIQHISIYYKAVKCPCKTPDLDEAKLVTEFWEAWPVDPGKQAPDLPKDPKRQAHDIPTARAVVGECGVEYVKGIIRVYVIPKDQDPFKLWTPVSKIYPYKGYPNRGTKPGIPSTDTMPAWWPQGDESVKVLAGEGVVARSTKLEWQCCDGKGSTCWTVDPPMLDPKDGNRPKSK